MYHAEAQPACPNRKRKDPKTTDYLVEDEYLVTALVPSDTACLASSPGRIRRTLVGNMLAKCAIELCRAAMRWKTHEVWISREEMVDFLL